MAKQWTIEDVLDFKSKFWMYTEDEVYDWLDQLSPLEQSKAFDEIEKAIALGQLRVIEPKSEDDSDMMVNLHRHRLKNLIEKNHVSVTMVNGMVALSAIDLTKLQELKNLMIENGNKFIEYRYRLNKNKEKVHTYIFIIEHI